MIHICIETHNRCASLHRLITSPEFCAALNDQTAVLVLNQASTDGTRALLDNLPHVTAWHSSQYTSYAAAVQRMIDRLIGAGLRPEDVIVLLNDDLRVLANDWLDSLMGPLEHERGVVISGALGSFITDDWHTRPAPPGPVDFVGAGWAAYRAALFLAGVEFDHAYSGCYWEDVDVCLQARSRGYVVWGGDGSRFRHDGSAGATAPRQALYEQNRARARARWEAQHITKGKG